jgi:hypothetical protein
VVPAPPLAGAPLVRERTGVEIGALCEPLDPEPLAFVGLVRVRTGAALAACG